MEYIGKRLVVEKKPVTAKFLSRTWKISSIKASEILDSFYNEHKNDEMFSGINVKYSIVGKQKCVGVENRHADILVKIVDFSQLNDIINNEFSIVKSSLVYCIQPNPNITISNVVEICKIHDWAYNEENMLSCGLIQTETSGIVDLKLENEIKRQFHEDQKHVKIETQKLSVSKESTNKLQQKSEERQRPVYVSRKASSTPTSATTSEPKKSLYTSRKLEKRPIEQDTKKEPSKRSKTMSDTEQSKRDAEKRELEKMMEDGFSDDDDFNDGVIVSGETGNAKQPDDEYHFDDIDLAESDEKTESPLLKKESENRTRNGDGKKRNVKSEIDSETSKDSKDPTQSETVPTEDNTPEVETYVDADGYVVRKVNRKSAPAPTKRSFTIETKTTKQSSGNAGKKQSSLMSFFKKK